MNSSKPNGIAGEPYNYRTHRSAELRRRNRRIGLIVALVAVGLIIFTVIYVNFFGGKNIGPREPFHSRAQALSIGGNAA